MGAHQFGPNWDLGDFLRPDPGDAGALKLGAEGSWGAFELVSIAAETRTLPAPEKAGEVVILSMKTDGGDIVVTAGNAINTAANTIMTFANAGETVGLMSVNNNGTFQWRIIFNEDSVALS